MMSGWRLLGEVTATLAARESTGQSETQLVTGFQKEMWHGHGFVSSDTLLAAPLEVQPHWALEV
eukprot:7413646-Pyramimonas_sp.AAC.1